MTTKVIQVYCPAFDKTVEGFQITPAATFHHVCQNLRTAFSTLKAVYLWDTEGNWIFDLAQVQNGQRILVTENMMEAMQAEGPFQVIRYDVPKRLSRSQVREVIRELCGKDSSSAKRNLRITMSPSEIRMLHNPLRNSSKRAQPIAQSLDQIETNWMGTLDQLFGSLDDIRPRASLPAYEKVCDLLSLLSDMTPGQASLVRRRIKRAIEVRGGEFICLADIVTVIEELLKAIEGA